MTLLYIIDHDFIVTNINDMILLKYNSYDSIVYNWL